ncbi:MAG: hypothetical protein OSA97_01030 [Nevskia sp.]|nr:hypothetical protein [Nevskia sp.]
MVQALLQELATKLDRLVREGHADSIDLRRLPLPPGALEALRSWFGQGEIEASVKALGMTSIRETAVAGVWWVQQTKPGGESIGEGLAITCCPDLLATHVDDVRAAAESLQLRLNALSGLS